MTGTPDPYTPCCSFDHWASCVVNEDLFHSRTQRIQELSTGEMADRAEWARDRILRTTAYETGAVENLYAEGATHTVAMEHEGWEIELANTGEGAGEHFADQLSAYLLMREWAHNPTERPLAEIDIRHIHETATASQTTYPVQTSLGTEHQEFISGAYKTQENRVVGRDGKIHNYALPAQVAPEMQNLLETIRSEKFASAHPVLQCAYIHWVIAHIHPFADGNGRVARVLSSLPLMRTYGIPLVVYAGKKRGYLQALEAADRHHHQQMVDYVSERTATTMSYLAELLEAAESELAAKDSIESIQQFIAFQEQGQLETREEAATRVQGHLLRLLTDEAAKRLAVGGMKAEISRPNYVSSDYRFVAVFNDGTYDQAADNISLSIGIEAVDKHRSTVSTRVGYAMTEAFAPVIVHPYFESEILYFSLEDCSPELSVETDLRLRNFAIRMVSEGTRKLKQELQNILKQHGRLPSSETLE